MDIMPKRRRYRDNPYTINKDSATNKYYVKFRDSNNIERFIEIDSTIYKIFDESELKDISEMNEYDNHIEHSEIYEYKIDLISAKNHKSVEELIEDKILYDDLKLAIDELPEIQKRRIRMYYFDDMKLREIAERENCAIMSVKNSIEVGIKKLKERLKKFNI